jgi:hypothetical protein
MGGSSHHPFAAFRKKGKKIPNTNEEEIIVFQAINTSAI